jgi:hypothetical protein
MFTIFALAATLTNPRFHYLQQVKFVGTLSADAQFYECGKYTYFTVNKYTDEGRYEIYPKGAHAGHICTMEVDETELQEIK